MTPTREVYRLSLLYIAPQTIADWRRFQRQFPMALLKFRYYEVRDGVLWTVVAPVVRWWRTR